METRPTARNGKRAETNGKGEGRGDKRGTEIVTTWSVFALYKPCNLKKNNNWIPLGRIVIALDARESRVATEY